MRDQFWTLPLADLTQAEWEALCDGCGKCCLNKLEYDDTGEVDFTRLACRLLDGEACRCRHYETRRDFVPDCVSLTADRMGDVAYWLPRTCAYRLRHEGMPLPDWHYLICGDPERVHVEGRSVRGWTIPETEVAEDDWDNYVIAERP
ncbi:MAG TPA: YcgN family cysteine cluster protein [Paracoccaceae bacterium]|nr:YcgN family cysteine cluster protein [Paracoccaceae bacterium]